MSKFRSHVVALIGPALLAGVGVAAIGLAVPAMAQRQIGSQFLEAVRDRDGTKVEELLTATATIIDTRSADSGETALHIVTARRDLIWIRFLLGRGADANIVDRAGQTPLILAAQLGFVDGIRALTAGGARVNFANGRGETPLHFAVQRRDVNTVRALIDAGADPDRQDSVSGMSPRDYAQRDSRAGAIIAVLDARATTRRPVPGIAGPN